MAVVSAVASAVITVKNVKEKMVRILLFIMACLRILAVGSVVAFY